MKKTAICFLLCWAVFYSARAQEDVQLSQLHANRLYVNPAGIIGTDELFRVSFTDKEQYWGKDFAGIRPSSRFLSATQYFKKAHSGVGLTVYHQNQNVLNTLLIKASYAYHLQVGKEAFMSLGVNVGYIDGFIDNSVTPRGDYIAGNNLDLEYKKPNLDVGVGVEFYTNEIVSGVSVAHLPIRLQEQGTMFDLHSYYYFGYTYKIDENWTLLPMISLRLARHSSNVDVNLRAFYKQWVYIGASYRIDAVSVMAGIHLGPQFSLGYALDINLPGMGRYVRESGKHLRPSHEIILSYRGCIFCSSGKDVPLLPID
jgi:type IX secretion system PorP/SprF family membrane protein